MVLIKKQGARSVSDAEKIAASGNYFFYLMFHFVAFVLAYICY
jgi:hypothetical protein